MDLFHLIDRQLDELENSTMQRIPRIRVFKLRVDYFTDLDETDFFARFRLSKYAVNQVHNYIKHKILHKTQRWVVFLIIQKILLVDDNVTYKIMNPRYLLEVHVHLRQ